MYETVCSEENALDQAQDHHHHIEFRSIGTQILPMPNVSATIPQPPATKAKGFVGDAYPGRGSLSMGKKRAMAVNKSTTPLQNGRGCRPSLHSAHRLGVNPLNGCPSRRPDRHQTLDTRVPAASPHDCVAYIPSKARISLSYWAPTAHRNRQNPQRSCCCHNCHTAPRPWDNPDRASWDRADVCNKHRRSRSSRLA